MLFRWKDRGDPDVSYRDKDRYDIYNLHVNYGNRWFIFLPIAHQLFTPKNSKYSQKICEIISCIRVIRNISLNLVFKKLSNIINFDSLIKSLDIISAIVGSNGESILLYSQKVSCK